MNNRVIRTILVDDEELAIEGLELRLKQFEHIVIVATCLSGEEAIVAIEQHAPDLVFLDMEMPGISGIEVVEALSESNKAQFVFVTAYKEYAIQAFELQAIDYLLKPVSIGRLAKTLDRLNFNEGESNLNNSQLQTQKRLLNALKITSGKSIGELEDWLKTDSSFPLQYPKKLTIKSSEHEHKLVPVSEIKWVDAAGDYVCLNTTSEIHVVRMTMKKLEEVLDPNYFQRIHKSTIVNLNYIAKTITLKNNELKVIMTDGTELKSSRNYKLNLASI